MHADSHKSLCGDSVLCGCLFWSKVLFSLALAFGGLGLLSYNVYDKHTYLLAHPIQPPQPAWVFPINGSDPSCWRQTVATTNTAAGRVEPPDSTTLFGVSLDWATDSVPLIVNRMGGIYKPAVYNSFIQMNATDFQVNMMNWQAQQIALAGGIYQVTLQPTVPMSQIPDATLQAVARQMAFMNGLYGVPIILRYGHEMNGDWYAYGQQPSSYVASFQKLARYVHFTTNMTAMMWAPNTGLYYPWTPNAQTSSADLTLLDTNQDGVFNVADDPYTPYWPGPEYVDWVGLSVYQYHQNSSNVNDYVNANVAVGPCFIQDYIQGTLNCRPRSAAAGNRAFYDNFAVTYNKPFALPESGAQYAVNATNVVPQSVDEATMKKAWIASAFGLSPGASNTPAFPLLKLIVNFEEAKVELETNTLHQLRDYRISHNKSVMGALISVFQPAARMLWAGQLSYQCGGQVHITKSSPSA
ncbi:mannan endo-1,4-beta-mannosidase [Synchytrium endobioticum]|uniref:Mannan endo-1,4-beta-mannosidase n=1 Tax=Synchytrium endobioticum TaxID=286115 RepID=A0A507CTY0_9FUNG|nr:mannan endo-1,4-beta-mannosidase [Synchytrium endobioticum]